MRRLFRTPKWTTLDLALAAALIIGVISQVAYYEIQTVRRAYSVPVVELTPAPGVPARAYQKDYAFTSSWFQGNIPTWSAALAPLKGKPGLNYLEVGVFEGAASMWMIENILTDPTSTLTTMDLFEGVYEEEHPDFEKRYYANLKLSGATARTKTLKGFSQVLLRELPLEHYDIIYIDGSHENPDVLEDAVLAWRLLKTGGIFIFDDYMRRDLTFGAPKLGIDEFMRFYGVHFEVLHNDVQVFLRKR